MREHRQHELAAHGGKCLQQPHEIRLVERSVVVAAVAAHIGRIDKMEGFGRIVAPDEMNAVFALDNNMFQPPAQLLGEGFAGIAEFLRRGPLRSYPNVPSIIEAKPNFVHTHTAHARSTDVKKVGWALICRAWA